MARVKGLEKSYGVGQLCGKGELGNDADYWCFSYMSREDPQTGTSLTGVDGFQMSLHVDTLDICQLCGKGELDHGWRSLRHFLLGSITMVKVKIENWEGIGNHRGRTWVYVAVWNAQRKDCCSRVGLANPGNRGAVLPRRYALYLCLRHWWWPQLSHNI